MEPFWPQKVGNGALLQKWIYTLLVPTHFYQKQIKFEMKIYVWKSFLLGKPTHLAKVQTQGNNAALHNLKIA